MNYTLIIQYLAKIPAIFFVITAVGFTKCLFSYILGDKSQKSTLASMLNPLKHFEPVGFLVYLFWGYGWGNPVKTNSMYYKSRKKANIIINIMPIIISFIMVFVFIFISNAALKANLPYTVILILFNFAVLSAKTAIVNILPVYPFCGWELLTNLLPPDKAWSVMGNKAVIQMVFILLLFIGILTGILDKICYFIFKVV